MVIQTRHHVIQTRVMMIKVMKRALSFGYFGNSASEMADSVACGVGKKTIKYYFVLSNKSCLLLKLRRNHRFKI